MTFKLVHIEWVDSSSTNGWNPIEELSLDLDITHTCGLLIHDNREFVVVAHSHDPQTDSYNGVITIPKVAIKKQRTVCRILMKMKT